MEQVTPGEKVALYVERFAKSATGDQGLIAAADADTHAELVQIVSNQSPGR